MNIENVLDDLKKSINESGFRLKEKGKMPNSIKLFHHVDTDGIVSAMVAYRQLVKQGIPPNRIELRPVQYGDQKPEFFNVKPNQKSVMVDYSELPEGARVPDILSDHHIKKDELTSKAGMRHGESRDPKRLEAQPERTQRSDTERLATLHAPNIAGGDFVNSVSRVDSADLGDMYKLNALVVDKENIRNVVNSLLTALAKQDLKTGDPNSKSTGATEWLIRNAPLSMMGLYHLMTSEKSPLKSIIGNEIELVKELKKKPEDRNPEKLASLMKAVGGVSKQTLRKVLADKGRSKPQVPLDIMKKQNKADVERATNPETSVFKARGNIIISELSGANQPHRYLGSLLTKQDGTRYPALMRQWPGMLQIALNPDLDKESKKDINLEEIVKSAIDEMKNREDQKWNGWAWDIIKGEAGGHKAIATVPGLYLLNMGPKRFREALKAAKNMKERASKFLIKNRDTKEGKEKIRVLKASLGARLKELEKQKEEFDKNRKASVDFLKGLILEKANKYVKGLSVKPLSHPEEFKRKPAPAPEEKPEGIKESIVYVLKNADKIAGDIK